MCRFIKPPQTDAEGRTFTFDGNNKQRFITDGNNATVGEYFYDGDGMRVKKKVYSGGTLSKTVIFVYSGGKLVEEYSTEAPPTDKKIKYLTKDHLGTPRIITDGNGAVVSRRDFMPFGEEIANNVGTRSTSSFKYSANEDDVRQKFTGYQQDSETNLDFAEARMYENRHARFTAVDPLLASGNSGNPQTFNRYVYVGNSPLQFTDPTGLIADYFDENGVHIGPDDNPDDERKFLARRTHVADGYQYVDVIKEISSDELAIIKFGASHVRAVAAITESRKRKPSPSRIDRFFSSVPPNPLQQAVFGFITGIGNLAIDTTNLVTLVGINSGRAFPTFNNPLHIQRFGCSGRINCNWQFGTEIAATLATPIKAGVFRATAKAPSFVPKTTTPFRFAQTTASPRFSSTGTFSNQTIGGLSNSIRNGGTRVNQVPVEFITKGNVNLIINTRSSLALKRANIPIYKWKLIDKSNDIRLQTKISSRLLDNSLSPQGANTLRITGFGRRASSLQ